MPNLISGGGQWTELDGAALGGGAVGLQLRRRRNNVYVFTSHRLGAVAGSLVPNGSGGFTIAIGDKSGSGRAVLVGSTITFR
jgi:hypothetical protein